MGNKNTGSSLKNLSKMALGSNKYDGDNMWNTTMGKFTDLLALDIDGNELKFQKFLGNVLLIVNVACK